MAKITNFLSSESWKAVKIFLLTLFLVIISPIIFLCFLLLLSVRRCISVSARIKDENLDTLLTPCESLLACDDLYGIPSNNVVAWFILTDNVSIDTLQNLILERLLTKRDALGHFANPHLRQFPIRHRNFMFWKWDEDFSLKSHVRVHEKVKDDDKSWSEADVLELQSNLLRKQWNRNKSLWEILLVPNYQPASPVSLRERKSGIFLRYHESLGNLLSLFASTICNQEDDTGRKALHNPSVDYKISKSVYSMCTEVLKGVVFPSLILKEFAEQIISPFPEKSPWNAGEKLLTKRDHFTVMKPFSIQHFKEIQLLDVHFTSIVLSAVTASIRKALVGLGLTIPKTVRITIPNLDEGQPEECSGCNHLDSCVFELPVSVAAPRERLRICEAMYRKELSQRAMTTKTWIRKGLGLLPVNIFKGLRKRLTWSGGTVVHFPVMMTESMDLGENGVEDCIIAVAPSTGFAVTLSSFGEMAKLSFCCDHRLIPATKPFLANDFLRNFYSELVELGIEAVV